LEHEGRCRKEAAFSDPDQIECVSFVLRWQPVCFRPTLNCDAAHRVVENIMYFSKWGWQEEDCSWQMFLRRGVRLPCYERRKKKPKENNPQTTWICDRRTQAESNNFVFRLKGTIALSV
jgi:hypothetical protein